MGSGVTGEPIRARSNRLLRWGNHSILTVAVGRFNGAHLMLHMVAPRLRRTVGASRFNLDPSAKHVGATSPGGCGHIARRMIQPIERDPAGRRRPVRSAGETKATPESTTARGTLSASLFPLRGGCFPWSIGSRSGARWSSTSTRSSPMTRSRSSPTCTAPSRRPGRRCCRPGPSAPRRSRRTRPSTSRPRRPRSAPTRAGGSPAPRPTSTTAGSRSPGRPKPRC